MRAELITATHEQPVGFRTSPSPGIDAADHDLKAPSLLRQSLCQSIGIKKEMSGNRRIPRRISLKQSFTVGAEYAARSKGPLVAESSGLLPWTVQESCGIHK
ncbi:UNVERIFIED_CONTAM: hypothetical protein K2H54_015228 [Gekko kuhli]